MADVTPNYRVEQQRLKRDIAQQEMKFEAHKLELMEMVDRRDRILANWDADKAAKADMEKRLAELEQNHGEITDADLGAALEAIGSAKE